MSQAIPLLILFLFIGTSLTVWGAMTEWTFSGLLPRAGAICVPDEKDANAKKYVYDEDKECLVIDKCKTEWEPNSSNTACIYSKKGEECLSTTSITNAKTYKKDADGKCTLAKSCDPGFKPSTDAKICVVDEGSVCTSHVTTITNATQYKFDNTGKCTLVKECDDGFIPGEDSKSCIDEWILPTKPKSYQVLGYLINKEGKDPPYDDSTETTIKGCREAAKTANSVMFGLRSTGNHVKEKSCWYYTDEKISEDFKIPEEPQANYWLECVDTDKSATKLCKE